MTPVRFAFGMIRLLDHTPTLAKRLLGICFLLVGLHFPEGATSATFTTFDVPGAGTASVQGTYAVAINPAGAIAGSYLDANNSAHGFVRAPDGTLSTFDPPGSTFTIAFSINPAGAVTGYFRDANNREHGYLRAADGTLTAFDPPNAGTGSFQGTRGASINPARAIVGLYLDAGNIYHAFLRRPNGVFTTFEAAGAGIRGFQGTWAVGINPAGAPSREPTET